MKAVCYILLTVMLLACNGSRYENTCGLRIPGRATVDGEAGWVRSTWGKNHVRFYPDSGVRPLAIRCEHVVQSK